MNCTRGHDLMIVGQRKDGFCKACAKMATNSWRRRHPERLRASLRRSNKRRLADPAIRADMVARGRAWNQANRVHVNQKVRARKARVGTITKVQVGEILAYYGQDCVYCGKPASGFDHLQPVAGGGLTVVENLAPCCKSCNSRKCDRPIWTMLVVA